MFSVLFLFIVKFKYVNVAVIQTYYCKMSMYKYKENLHNTCMLIHTAVHLILLNSVHYTYSQSSFISLYLYASLKKKWLYIVMTCWWIMLAGCASDVKIWYSHKIHTIRWGVPDYNVSITTNQHYSSRSHHNIHSLLQDTYR
jgi:hypothetical protein